MSRAAKAGVTKAQRVRAKYGIGLDGPVPDLLALVEEDCGVPVAIFADLGGDLAGVYLPREGKPVILLNGADSASRLRFTLAHELCHHVFDDAAQRDTHAGIVRPGHWIEVRANSFAAELLMPAPAVVGYEPTVEAVTEIACRFGASPIAAVIRLETAGIATAEEAKALKAAIEEDPPAVEYEDSISAARRSLPRIPNPRSPLALGLPDHLARVTDQQSG